MYFSEKERVSFKGKDEEYEEHTQKKKNLLGTILQQPLPSSAPCSRYTQIAFGNFG